MSIEVTSLVISRKIGSPSRKVVLMIMADAANPDGTGVWVSKPNIAKRSEVSLKTVKRAIKDMVEEGLLSATGERKNSNGFTTIYNLNLPKITQLPLTQTPKSDTGQNDPRPTVTPDTGKNYPPTRGKITPQTVKEPSRNRPFLSLVREEWNGMARQVGLPEIELMGPDRVTWIAKRLELVNGNEESVLAAIRRVPNNDHWTGANGKGFQATFDWVFKDPVRFRQALESVPPPQTPKAQNDHRPNRETTEQRAERQSREADNAVLAAVRRVQEKRLARGEPIGPQV